jgi:hypothetical protein
VLREVCEGRCEGRRLRAAGCGLRVRECCAAEWRSQVRGLLASSLRSCKAVIPTNQERVCRQAVRSGAAAPCDVFLEGCLERDALEGCLEIDACLGQLARRGRVSGESE